MHVLFATTEFAPLVKSGGLADVSAALPSALAAEGCRVGLVLPGYPAALQNAGQTRALMELRALEVPVRILEGRFGRLPVYLVACEPLFGRAGGPYGDPDGQDFPDNALRFAVFGRAIASLVACGARVGCHADVVHLNDWPTALAAGWAAALPRRPGIVFSIHNLVYQGLFPGSEFFRLNLPRDWWTPDRLEFFGRLSFIKAGLVFADRITTVSPGYAAEIHHPDHGAGLDGLVRHLSGKLTGILNGIDHEVWNPATDPHLVAGYDAGTLEPKARNKRALRAELELEQDHPGPLLGFVGRLVPQKGIDLIIEAADALTALPAQLAVLGVGEPYYERALTTLAERHRGRIAFVRRSDESLAHRIEAGADMFLMPSRFEPCGLNQMYSLRYGTVPVVRRTGGLADTVQPVTGAHVGDGTGFLFDDPTPEALVGTLRAALDLYHQPGVWQRIQHNGMTRDFSWQQSARRYLALYRSALQAARGV